jgi:hypothetical protein
LNPLDEYLTRKVSTGHRWCDNCQQYVRHYRRLGEMGLGYCGKCGAEAKKRK